MGLDWNKKRIIQLSYADVDMVEQWLDEFADVIYTWQYYQVGADAEIAADLTIRTFKQAVQNLEQYNPDIESMLQWLREQAKQARDEGLLFRQMKPQRPWAWSQLPDEVLCGLSHLRDEPLQEEVPNNPFVREIVQASLAEMEPQNRDLMMHRYSHLETPEHIANETGKSISDVNDRLYRCRHFFRRMFVQLVESVNSGFAESASPGTLEILDANLEKLLSSTEMVQPVSKKNRAKMREFVFEASRQATPIKDASTEKKYILPVGIGIIVLVAVVFVVWLNLSSDKPAPRPVTETTPQQETTTPAATESNPAQTEDKLDEEELKRIFMLGQAGDLAALLEVLKDGQYTSQITAAHFIGKLGGESAIGMLEESEIKWYPNGPDSNPFADAIAQIEERLLAQSGAVIEEADATDVPQETEAVAAEESIEKPKPPSPEPMIHGVVTDFAGQPMPNAQITLSENPLYGPAMNVKAMGQRQTDNEGVYRFRLPPTGAFYIDCKPQPDGTAVSRSIWCEKTTDCQFNFGDEPSVFGILNAAPESAAGQILYLSDTLDPADSAFRAETVTDADGTFSFTGIEPGAYYVLNNTESNRIVRLETLTVSEDDISDWQLTVQQARVVVQVETSENMPAVFEVALTYGPDVSNELELFPLSLQDDGTYASDTIPTGSYTLITRLENDMRLQQPLELNSDRELTVLVPEGSGKLSGNFTNSGSYHFFLYNTDQRVRFDMPADAGGPYMIDAIPPDVYTLAASINNLQLDFMEIDLETEPEQILDIDAGELLKDLSPLYVAVTDARGALLNDVQVWVTGPGEVVTTQSTGRGAFLAIPPAEYTLYAAQPGFSTAEKVIQVGSMPLQTGPNEQNTIHLQLKSP